MADPFSIAASAIAVAGAGVKLAEALYSFIDDFRKAERHLRPIAHHVELTSAILENVGFLLQAEEIQILCQGRLLGSTDKALKGCEGAFKELEAYLKGLTKVKKDGSRSLTSWDKAVWSYRQKETDVLQAHLERFKSSLDLVLGVLNLISSSRNLSKSSNEIDALKSQVNRLLKIEEEAKAKDTALSKQRKYGPAAGLLTPLGVCAAVNPTSFKTANRDGRGVGSTGQHRSSDLDLRQDEPTPHNLSRGITTGPVALDLKANAPLATQRTGIVSMASRRSEDPAPAQHDEELLQHLTKCAEAVAALSSSIEAATKLWEAQKRYKPGCTAPAFNVAQRPMKRLRDFDGDFEPFSKRQQSFGYGPYIRPSGLSFGGKKNTYCVEDAGKLDNQKRTSGFGLNDRPQEDPHYRSRFHSRGYHDLGIEPGCTYRPENRSRRASTSVLDRGPDLPKAITYDDDSQDRRSEPRQPPAPPVQTRGFDKIGHMHTVGLEREARDSWKSMNREEADAIEAEIRAARRQSRRDDADLVMERDRSSNQVETRGFGIRPSPYTGRPERSRIEKLRSDRFVFSTPSFVPQAPKAPPRAPQNEGDSGLGIDKNGAPFPADHVLPANLNGASNMPPPPPLAPPQRSGFTERERKPYTRSSFSDQMDDDDLAPPSIPIERERKPYSAKEGSGKVYASDDGRDGGNGRPPNTQFRHYNPVMAPRAMNSGQSGGLGEPGTEAKGEDFTAVDELLRSWTLLDV